MLVSCAWIFRIFERAGIWYWRDKRKVHNPNISFQCLKLSWLFIENSKIGSWRPEAVRGGPTLPRLVSGTWNFLNCETFKCGSCTRVRPTLAHEPFITHAGEGWQLQRPNKSRRNVFVRLCEAKSCTDGLLLRLLHKRRIVFRAGCARTIPMQGLDEAKPSFAISPSHGANPAFSLHIAQARTYFSLARILQLFWEEYSYRCQQGLLRLPCFLLFELVLAAEEPEPNLFASPS